MLRRTDHRGEDLLARGAVRFPPQTFSRDGGPQPLLGAPIGRVDRGGVKEEREERGPFDSEMDGESPHVGDRARMIELYKDGILDQACGTVRYGSRPAKLGDSQTRQRLGEAGRRAIERTYHWDNDANKLLAALASIVTLSAQPTLREAEAE
jgi:hypothetical protein